MCPGSTQFLMAHPVGFEPTTPGFVDRCSNPTELRVLEGALLSGSHPGPSRKRIPLDAQDDYNTRMNENSSQPSENTQETPRFETDEFAEKRFRGWRLIGFIFGVVFVLAAISFLVDWAVIGPLEGRVF
jgi:hypothetical protein